MSDPQTDLVEVISSLLDTSTARVEGMVVVRIQSFDRVTQTAEVIPQVLKNGEQQPNIQNVPVLFPVAYQDIQIGSDPVYGVLLVGGLNWRRWWRTGEVSPPEDTTSHGLTNGILLPGLTTQGEPRPLDANSTVLECAPGGSLRLGVYSANKAALHEALLTDLNSFLGVLTTWGATDHGTWSVAAGAWTASVAPKISTLITGIAFGVYKSPTVMVED